MTMRHLKQLAVGGALFLLILAMPAEF